MTLRFLIPAQISSTETVVLNSRFIATAGPVFSTEEGREFIRSVRGKYSDATHNVPAYVIGFGASVSAYCSDDGEPAGSAGRPILSVLQGCGMGDIAIVVTRYFGGTKLGIGGLVHAYGGAAKAVLEIMPCAVKVPTVTVMTAFPYAYYERVKILTLRWNGKIIDEDFSADVTLSVLFLEEKYESFCADLRELTAGKVSAEVIDVNPQTILPLEIFAE